MSRLSHQLSKAAYYIEDCRIVTVENVINAPSLILSTRSVAQACMASKTSWQIRGDHHDLRQVKTFSTELEKRLAVSPTFS